MNLQGQEIIHKTFGKGTVIDHSADCLAILFNEEQKRFIYPDAFTKFITATDPEVNAAIMKEIAGTEAAKTADIEAANQRRVDAEAARIVTKKRTAKVIKSRRAEAGEDLS